MLRAYADRNGLIGALHRACRCLHQGSSQDHMLNRIGKILRATVCRVPRIRTREYILRNSVRELFSTL